MRPRHGFTLIEVVIALVIMGVVTGAVYQLLNTTQRLSLAQAEQVSLQSNVRTGSLVVPNELRELNTVLGSLDPTQNDVLDADADGIQYRAMRGLGTVCVAPAVGAIELRLARSTWTGLREIDAARDDLYLFVDGDPDEDGDDAWLPVVVINAAASANACGGAPGIVLTTSPLLAVPLNTPVRVYEVMELRLYDSDGNWWLGARSVSAGENLQPVIGPLTNDGLLLEYLNSAGAVTADPTAIQSIRVTVRGLSQDAVRAHGTGAVARQQEALVTQVLLRNSIRP